MRINGDGTIRLIYSGDNTPTSEGEGTQIGTSAFNSSNGDNMYVGYMYTENEVHGLGTSSTIKGVLDNWYNNNLSSYASYIDINAGFCGDRSPSTSSSSSNGSGGTGGTTTYYGAYIRLKTNQIPTFRCSNSSDLYTLSDSNKGNNVLTYPIGLITADEVAYASGVNTSANSYLYTGQGYWTLSPYYVDNYDWAFVVSVYPDGILNGTSSYFTVTQVLGVRPVINLRADVTISSGDGSSSKPFVIA